MGRPSNIDEIMALYAERGSRDYGGEAVTQCAHALQCAHLAELSGAPPALVAASFLHDIAHLLGESAAAALAKREDLKHESEGAHALRELFPPDVTEPVRLHVAAKRYLVATDQLYASRLSMASQQSLMCQGGPFDAPSAAAFASGPHAAAAMALRRFDDGAKDPNAKTPDLAYYRDYLIAASRASDR